MLSVDEKGEMLTEHHGPVVVAIAASGGGGNAIELVVGDSKTGCGIVGDDEHAADEREFVVVNPDAIVATLEIKSITSPHDTGVDVGELEALDDDVLCVLGQRKTLAL